VAVLPPERDPVPVATSLAFLQTAALKATTKLKRDVAIKILPDEFSD